MTDPLLELLDFHSHLSMMRIVWTDFLREAVRDLECTPRVTSWVRSPEHNAAVGGLPNSKHLTGDAIDVVWTPLPSRDAVAAFCARHGVRLVREHDHDHFQF